jgi:tRNA (adenine22-N1)-methyltransferase
MGSHTIVEILYNNINKLKTIDTLILQSNNDLDFLRYKITKLGFYIAKETLVKDKKIIYTIIKLKKGHKFYTKKQLYFGPCLLKENSKLFQEKNKIELEKLKKIYPLISKNHYHHKIKIYLKIKLYNKI